MILSSLLEMMWKDDLCYGSTLPPTRSGQYTRSSGQDQKRLLDINFCVPINYCVFLCVYGTYMRDFYIECHVLL